MCGIADNKKKKKTWWAEKREKWSRESVVPKSLVKINTFPKNFNRFCFHIIPFFVFVFRFCRDSFPSYSCCCCCCCCRAPLHSSFGGFVYRFYQLRVPICRIYLNAHYTVVLRISSHFIWHILPIHISLVLSFLPIILLLTFVFILV